MWPTVSKGANALPITASASLQGGNDDVDGDVSESVSSRVTNITNDQVCPFS